MADYYLQTQSLSLVEQYFPGDYDEYDSRYYRVHLNRLYYRWLPLFQKHQQFDTFAGLKEFYHRIEKKHLLCPLSIVDDCGHKLSLDKYEETIMNHIRQQRHRPYKWTYRVHELFGDKPILTPELCDESEAELFEPFSHVEYARTQEIAEKRFNTYAHYRGTDHAFSSHDKYKTDPCLPIDWIDRKIR